MGRHQHTKDRRSKFAREESLASRSQPDCWEVHGTSQHGDEVRFRTTDRLTAAKHVERMNGLGGSVALRHLVWNGPAAEYREASE